MIQDLENRNGRIYSCEEYKPHLDALNNRYKKYCPHCFEKTSGRQSFNPLCDKCNLSFKPEQCLTLIEVRNKKIDQIINNQ